MYYGEIGSISLWLGGGGAFVISRDQVKYTNHDYKTNYKKIMQNLYKGLVYR